MHTNAILLISKVLSTNKVRILGIILDLINWYSNFLDKNYTFLNANYFNLLGQSKHFMYKGTIVVFKSWTDIYLANISILLTNKNKAWADIYLPWVKFLRGNQIDFWNYGTVTIYFLII